MVQLAPGRGQATNYRLGSGLGAILPDPDKDQVVIGQNRTCKSCILAEERLLGANLDGLWTQGAL